MIVLTMASAVSLLALQASVNVPRSAFGTCISEAAEKAKSEKVTGEGIVEYLRTACDPAAAKLKNALIAFDTKNGVARARAAEDAQMELDDTLQGASRTYKRMQGQTAQ
jgi:hypothetical protein